MAAAFFNHLADPRRQRPSPPGQNPVCACTRRFLTVMQEVGIYLSHAKPQKLTEELAREAQLLITMGCGDKCPYVPGLSRDDWPLRDPKGLPIAEVRAIRDDIKNRVQVLLSS
jgi:protein-tyrosine-phosphatase